MHTRAPSEAILDDSLYSFMLVRRMCGFPSFDPSVPQFFHLEMRSNTVDLECDWIGETVLSESQHPALFKASLWVPTLHRRDGRPSESPWPASWCLPPPGSPAVSAFGLAERACLGLGRTDMAIRALTGLLLGLEVIAFLRSEWQVGWGRDAGHAAL